MRWMEMLTYSEALAKILADARPVAEAETIPLMYSTNRVLAQDIVSPITNDLVTVYTTK